MSLWGEITHPVPLANSLPTSFPSSPCFSSSCETRTPQLVRTVGVCMSQSSQNDGETLLRLPERIWRVRMEERLTLLIYGKALIWCTHEAHKVG